MKSVLSKTVSDMDPPQVARRLNGVCPWRHELTPVLHFGTGYAPLDLILI